MKNGILIRNETSADVNAIAEITVAAFKTLAISRALLNFTRDLRLTHNR